MLCGILCIAASHVADVTMGYASGDMRATCLYLGGRGVYALAPGTYAPGDETPVAENSDK